MTKTDTLSRLYQTVQAVCPVVDISVGKLGDSTSVAFNPAPQATAAQQAQAQSAINTFDWSQAAQDAWQVQHDRGAAQTMLSATAAEAKLFRAVTSALLDEVNTLRAAMVPPLPARTLDQ